ncbi:MAG TPA: DUF924 family protein [Xanthobacteraceae bacterium]|nr:DUF924 family protein [Xanthobacteraceae bacterium]
MNVAPQDIIAFWQAAGQKKWFEKDADFDEEIRTRFLDMHEAAARGDLDTWSGTPEGALALLILLDQFPRNLFRGEARAYATDAKARERARAALARGFEQKVPQELRTFFYLPFMHSENLADQERCVELYRALGDDYSLKYAEDHADIIRRFGRFPHRNAILGRETTAEEQAFLDAGGFAG